MRMSTRNEPEISAADKPGSHDSGQTVSPPGVAAKRDAKRRHVVISGTGRAGTSFLMLLLTRLGLDTGFGEDDLKLDALAHAGLERDLRLPAPYIVKDPWLCTYVEEIVRSPDIAIEHAIIPVRDLHGAAESRAHISRIATDGAFDRDVPGGLWLTKQPSEQKDILARNFYRLVSALVEHEVPMTFVSYPRIVRDPAYLFATLRFLLSGIDFATFERTFHEIVRPEWVHSFDKPA